MARNCFVLVHGGRRPGGDLGPAILVDVSTALPAIMKEMERKRSTESVEAEKFHSPIEQREEFENLSIASTIIRAAEVIGDRKEAMRWLGTPVRGLNFATPISLLGTKDGVTLVNDILGQMEHGIW